MVVLLALVLGFALRTTNHPVLQATFVRVKPPFQILLASVLWTVPEVASVYFAGNALDSRLGIVSEPYFSALEGWTATSLGLEFSLRGHG